MLEHIIRNHRIIQGDCVAILADLPEASVDVVVTSPPYNIGTAYATYHDRKLRDDYLHWTAEVGRLVARALKPSGAYFLNIGSTNQDPWVMFDVANQLRDIFVLQNHIIWVKSISIGHDTVGHFKPISSPRFLNQNHEAVFHFTKSGRVPIDRLAIGVPFKDKSNIERRGHAQDRRCAGNTWFLPYPTVQAKAQKYNHPAGFPVSLPERCLKLHGVEDAVVLDPFMGAGSTLIAAERLGMHGIGIEIDPYYIDAAVQRLNAEPSRSEATA